MNHNASTGTRALVSAVILSLAAAVFLVRCDDAAWLHPDTAQALSVARNLLQGHGFSTSIIYYEEHYQLQNWPAPQTVFPIGFPMMTAALASVGVPLRTAAWSIGVTGFLLVPPLICLSGQRLGRGFRASLIPAALWLCFPMVWHNVWERQTEMMFISLTFGSFILLQHEAPTIRRLLLAGLLAALAFTLRYAGVFWFVTVALVFITQIPRGAWITFQRGLAFFLFPATFAISLFGRNYLLLGDFKGGNNKPVDRTLREAAEAGYYAASRFAGLDRNDLFSGDLYAICATLGILLLLAAALYCLVRSQRTERSLRLVFRTPGDAAIVLYIVVSAVALLALEKTTSINLSPRMLLPIIPFLLLAITSSISGIIASLATSTLFVRSIPAAASALILIGILGGQFRAADDIRSQVQRFGMIRDMMDQRIDGATSRLTAGELLDGARILTDEPHMLAEVLKQGAVGLTAATYSNRSWSDQNVLDLIHRYQIDRVVVFPTVLPKDQNPFFDDLTQRHQVHDPLQPWLKPLVLTQEIQIYEVLDSHFVTQTH